MTFTAMRSACEPSGARGAGHVEPRLAAHPKLRDRLRSLRLPEPSTAAVQAPEPALSLEDSPFPPECRRKFHAVRLLGHGGFGKVWLATQSNLGRPVAVKLLETNQFADVPDAQIVEQFRREAQITAALSSPHIVRIIDCDIDDEIPWIAYEYLSGPTLRQTLEERGAMDWRSAARIILQVARALEEAHRAGVLHSDIKPENILESQTDVYKVIDFGLGTWKHMMSSISAGKVVLGTPGYLSPEQIFGRPVTYASDLYVLGVLFYECLTGEIPFGDLKLTDMMLAHKSAPPPRPGERRSGIPTQIDRIVQQSMAKRPQDRFESVTDFIRAVEAILLPPASEGGPRRMTAPSLARSGRKLGAAVPTAPTAAEVAAPAARPDRMSGRCPRCARAHLLSLSLVLAWMASTLAIFVLLRAALPVP